MKNTEWVRVAPDGVLGSCEVKRSVRARSGALFTPLLPELQSQTEKSEALSESSIQLTGETCIQLYY